MTHFRSRSAPPEVPEADSESLVSAQEQPEITIEAGIDNSKEKYPTFRFHSFAPEPFFTQKTNRSHRKLRRESGHQVLSRLGTGGTQLVYLFLGASIVLIVFLLRRESSDPVRGPAVQTSNPQPNGTDTVDGSKGDAEGEGRNKQLPPGGWNLHSQDQLARAASQGCWSLQDKYLLYPPPLEDSIPTRALLDALRKYETLHKGCTAGLSLSRWEENFKELLPGLKHCKYLIWLEPGGGVGTRLMSLLSAFLYALLTDRALLIRSTEDLDSLLCDPFPWSSWWLPDRFFPPSLEVAPHQGEYVNGSSSNWVHPVPSRPLGSQPITP